MGHNLSVFIHKLSQEVLRNENETRKSTYLGKCNAHCQNIYLINLKLSCSKTTVPMSTHVHFTS